VWQSIYVDLKDQSFVVIAVAMDDADAARPWIEAAKPTYPCVIDRDHHVADLYNMVNVEAALHFAEASRLHPESWTIWRQSAQKDASGLATGPEFWARVDALGDRPYHRPIDMKGV